MMMMMMMIVAITMPVSELLLGKLLVCFYVIPRPSYLPIPKINMYVCMYVCMTVLMYVCMYSYVCAVAKAKYLYK